jgi:hypothetical protein
VKTQLLSIAAAVLAGACCSATAFAQTGSMRPYSSLFEGTGSASGTHESLSLSLSAAEAYDDNQLADAAGGSFSVRSPIQKSGFYTGFDGTLGYDWTGKRVQFASNAGADARYYADTHQLVPVNYGGGAGLSVEFARRSQFFVNQSLSYSPSLFYSLLPVLGSPVVGSVVGAGSDLSLAKQDGYVSDTSTRLSVGVTARSTLTAIGNYRYSTFARASGAGDYRSYSVGGQYAYTLNRDATLHFGYTRREAGYSYTGRGGPAIENDIDAGVAYHRALSFSRRTHFDFNVGTAIVTLPVIGAVAPPQSAGTRGPLQYRVIGTGGLSRDIGRTWKARVSYNRGIGYVEAFPQPILSDAVNLSMAGFFTRRVDLRIGGGMSYGSLDGGNVATPSQNRLSSYTADAKLRLALTSRLAMYAQYLFYKYGAGAAIVLPAGVPPSLDRNSVRIGLTWWLPVVKR